MGCDCREIYGGHVDPRWECPKHGKLYHAADVAASLLCIFEQLLKDSAVVADLAAEHDTIAEEVRAAFETLRAELPDYHGT